MIELIFSLFLGKTIQITPTPVDIGSHYDLTINNGVVALTHDAAIQVLPLEIDIGNVSARDVPGLVESRFKSRDLRGILYQSTGGQRVELEYRGNFIQSENGIRLLLEPATPIPKRISFDKIEITSKGRVGLAIIYWRNNGGK